MTFAEFLASPARPRNQTGTVFIDPLHAAGKSYIANSLAYHKCDPFGKDSVSEEAIDVCRRIW
jgi:hypothetical protein